MFRQGSDFPNPVGHHTHRRCWTSVDLTDSCDRNENHVLTSESTPECINACCLLDYRPSVNHTNHVKHLGCFDADFSPVATTGCFHCLQRAGMGPKTEFVLINTQCSEFILKGIADIHKESGYKYWKYRTKGPFSGRSSRPGIQTIYL